MKDAFKAFYAGYEKACRDGDKEFLRGLLPPDIPADELSFVIDMSRQSAQALAASGVRPTFAFDGNRCDVIYEGDLGDGMSRFAIDFYWVDGKWLKYDPNA